MVAAYEPYVDVCRRLGELSPCRGTDQSRCCSTPAPRPSRTRSRSPAPRTGRPAIVAFDRGFHGRTLMTMTLTSKVKPYKKGFGPFAPEVYRAPAPYPYRGIWHGRRDRRAGELFLAHVDPATVAAVDARAGAGRGRLHPDAGGLPGAAARAAATPRDPVDRRRGPGRRRPHGPGVGDRALRRAAGPARLGQVARRRAAAGGGHRARRRSWTPSTRAGSAARSAATRSPARRRTSCSSRCRRMRAHVEALGDAAARRAGGHRDARRHRSARSAGSGRCSRWRSCATARPRRRRPELVRGAIAAARADGPAAARLRPVRQRHPPAAAADDHRRRAARGLEILEAALRVRCIPLDPLSADEFRQAAASCDAIAASAERWRFASIELREPAKGALASRASRDRRLLEPRRRRGATARVVDLEADGARRGSGWRASSRTSRPTSGTSATRCCGRSRG